MTALTSVFPNFGYRYNPRRIHLLKRPVFENWMVPYSFYGRLRRWSPAVDISETEGEYVFTFELPGVDRESLDISYRDNLLTVKGLKKENVSQGGSCHCPERLTGRFERNFRIPGKFKKEGIQANYNDGILKISFPKSEESEVRKIEITS